MRIGVIGYSGMLGSDLFQQLNAMDFRVIGLSRPRIDITNRTMTFACLRDAAPDLVINCAAYTAVDKAEAESEAAFLINRDGAANLANVCGILNIPLIHISTDYVFDGEKKRPYSEADATNPLNTYGQSKWEGEEAIRTVLPQHLIIRTSWLYGLHGHNFVKTIIRLAQERTELKVVADQIGCPTWTVDLATTIVLIANEIAEGPSNIAWGTYHYCTEGEASWYHFAQAIIDQVGQYMPLELKQISPIATEDYATPARRPPYSVLDCAKIRANFAVPLHDWHDRLNIMLADWLNLIPAKDKPYTPTTPSTS